MLKTTPYQKRLIIDNVETYDKDLIANSFNKYFSSIGSNVASKILSSSITYDTYACKNNSTLFVGPLTDK